MPEEEGLNLPQYTENGHQIVAPTYETTPNDPLWKGFRGTHQAGVQSFNDYEITTEIALQGGICTIINENDVHEDDQLDFYVIDKNDVLELFSTYGLTVGVDVLELGHFVRDIYVYKRKDLNFVRNGKMDVVAGLFLRVGYKSGGSIDIKTSIEIIAEEKIV